MTPANNALERTYFIGGPPRVGKTTLAYRLGEKIKGHVVSTDAIRNSAKKVCADKTGPLFMINQYNEFSEAYWTNRYQNKPQKVIEDQNNESKAIWRSVISFCNMFCEDAVNHIVEGIAVLPELVETMEHKPKHIFFVGNTKDDHVEAILDYGKRFPEQDWIAALEYSEEKARAFANYVKYMSIHFKEEAEKYGYPYFEMSDDNFDARVEQIISEGVRV